MSHLKEPIVINFTANALSDGAIELLYPANMRFMFNENFYGSYCWLPTANWPSSTVTYIFKELNANVDFGSLQIFNDGQFIFNTQNSSPYYINAGDIIRCSSSSVTASGIGTFGVSLVGER